MDKRYIILNTILLALACVEPTLVEDCSGVPGGSAVVDDCGGCSGGTTGFSFNYLMGCDGECGSGKIWDSFENCCIANKIDCEGICHGGKIRDYCGLCDGDNSACLGCTDSTACNYESTATYYEEGICTYPQYYCTDSDSNGFADLGSYSGFCSGEEVPDSLMLCQPGSECCGLFFECDDSTDSDEIATILTCTMDACVAGPGHESNWLGDGICDFFDTNCFDLDYDGQDCNLYDCVGLHYSNNLCADDYDSTYVIEGCYEGENAYFGDGECDEGLLEPFFLNFNCAAMNFDDGDCDELDTTSSFINTGLNNYQSIQSSSKFQQKIRLSSITH